MTHQELTEDFLLQLTGLRKLSYIKKLNLSEMNIHKMDPKLFKKLTNLEELDISNNVIEEFPFSIGLEKLRILDVSGNQLQSVTFIEQFPCLKELHCLGNSNLQSCERYMALELCPSLESVDRCRSQSLQSVVDNYRQQTKLEVEDVWKKNFARRYKDGIAKHCIRNIVRDVLKKTFSCDDEDSMSRFKRLMIERAAKQLVTSLADGTCSTQNSSQINNSSPSKKAFSPKSSPVKASKMASPRKAAQGNNGHEPMDIDESPSKVKSPSKRNLIDTTNISGLASPSKREKMSPVKSLRSPSKFTALKSKSLIENLPGLPDYEPAHFLRCHSKKNDPKDSKTKLWSCAFEPNIHRPGETTHMVATVGGESLCVIDCSTGSVMKKYQCPGEELYAACWSTIDIETKEKSRPTNILAVAGVRGLIYLLHIDQLVCYAAMEGHHSYISSLLFHPQLTTVLFSGSADGKVIIWDVGTLKFPDYKVSYRKLMVLPSPGGDVLNLEFCSSSQYLLAGCENGLYCWKMTETTLQNKCRPVATELILPDHDSDNILDALTVISDNLIAAKYTGQGQIYVWKFEPGKTNKSKRTVDVQAVLQWQKTEVEYINLGNSSGSSLLVAGDSQGSLWLYNMEHFSSNPSTCSEKQLAPSRILNWPECAMGDAERDKAMVNSFSEEKLKDLVINNVAVSSDQRYIVGGTDNNLVCVWKLL